MITENSQETKVCLCSVGANKVDGHFKWEYIKTKADVESIGSLLLLLLLFFLRIYLDIHV